jgi:hypothetical protein
MDIISLFLLKSAVCHAVFLGIYLCFLKNQTFFGFNRAFLLSGILLSVILPLYTYTKEVTLSVADASAFVAGNPAQLSNDNFWAYVFLTVYTVGILFFIIRHLLAFLKFKKMIARLGFTSVEDYNLVHTADLKSSFSMYNYIFLDTSSDLSETETKLVLAHEIAHVRQQHWADLLLAQLYCALQWFNPLAWLYMKAIRENHEYLADRSVLQEGISVAIYRAILVNHCIGTRVFSLSSSFYQYSMPRIKMLARPSSAWVNKASVALLLPAIGLFYWSFSETHINLKTVPAKQIVSTPGKTSIEKDLVASNSTVLIQPVKKVKIRVKQRAKISEPATATDPLYLLNGVEVLPNLNEIDQNLISEVRVFKNEHAIKEFGERGRNGVVVIITKDHVK